MPVKDIADEAKDHLGKDVEKVTPPDLKIAMKGMYRNIGIYEPCEHYCLAARYYRINTTSYSLFL